MKHPPCSTFIFFFSRVNAYHWIRTLMKVTYTIAFISLAPGLLMLMVIKISRVVRAISGAKSTKDGDPNVGVAGGESLKTQTAEATPPDPTSFCAICGGRLAAGGCTYTCTSVSPKDLDSLGTITRTATVLILGFIRAFVVVTIETTIKWNNIRGVNGIGSTGQLLPLIIAGGGLCTILHKWYKLKTK